MAKISYNDYEAVAKKAKENSGSNRKLAYYFSLRDDGDTAIVRFPYKSVEEFDMVAVHSVKLTPDSKFPRSVNCLRTPYEPLEKCPLCAAGVPVSTRFFVKMIEYVKGEDGNITVEPRVWDKAAGFRKVIKAFLDEYGDLSNYIFKIRRNGARGDRNTTYDVLPVNMAMYDSKIYVKDFSAFENFSLFKFFVLDKKADELKTYLETGEMPMPAKVEKEEGTEIKTFNPEVKAKEVEKDVSPVPTRNTTMVKQAPVNKPQEAVRPIRRYEY